MDLLTFMDQIIKHSRTELMERYFICMDKMTQYYNKGILPQINLQMQS